MPFELRVALRYLLAQRRQLFISVISTISTLGVVVGVMILLIALAILTGVQGELRSRILGAASHLSVYHDDGRAFEDYREVIETLRTIEEIEGAAPVIYGKALVSSATGSALVTLKGIDPELEKTVTEFGERMLTGDLSDLSAAPGENGEEVPAIVLGDELATVLGVFVGDTVRLTSPEGHLTPFMMLPRIRNFRVAGIFRLGLYDFDNSWALLDLPETQRLLGLGDEAMYVETKVRDLYAVEETEIAAMTKLGPNYGSMNWIE
ncbi:MAG: ABC transporter permease, partial [Vicinamibacteria bacterium]